MEEMVRWFGPCFGAAMVIYWLYRYHSEKTNDQDKMMVSTRDSMANNESTNKYGDMTTQQMLERVIKNVGCHINMCKENDGEFHITYQGEHFTIAYSEGNHFIVIYDIAWYSAELDDIDNLSIVRQAVNLCNQQNSSTVLYTIDKENNCINVHTRQNVVFGSYIPDLDEYFRSRLEDSFRQHHNFFRCLETSRKEQYV